MNGTVNTSQTPSGVEKSKSNSCVLNESKIILSVCYGIVFFVGVTGNALVLFIFRQQWKKGPIIELLILYLAVFDLLASIFGPFLFLYWIVTCHSQWDFGLTGCKMLPALCRVFTNISIGVILIMAIDRCRVIVTPLRRRFSRKIIHASVGLCVLLSFLWEYYYVEALQLDERGNCNTISVTEPSYSYPLVILTFCRDIAFIAIFSATTIAVYVQLEQNSLTKLLLKSKKQTRQRSKKVMKMLVAMAIVFSLAVIPRDILHLVYTISWMDGKGIKHTHGLLHANDIAKLLQVSNSIYNVFIYGKMHDQFWSVLKAFLLCQKVSRLKYSFVEKTQRFTASFSSSIKRESKKKLIEAQDKLTETNSPEVNLKVNSDSAGINLDNANVAKKVNTN